MNIAHLLTCIISCHTRHAKWLNTLSYLENCGARKIAAYEHPTLVKEETLKHAAEEFRHALHLKRQIQKIIADPMETYTLSLLLGHTTTLHYLHALDLQTCRYLQQQGLDKNRCKEAAYILVTYAIEKRAEELYPLYDALLHENSSRVTVRSIILEEKEHLQEMQAKIALIPEGYSHAQEVLFLEKGLYNKWLNAVQKDL